MLLGNLGNGGGGDGGGGGGVAIFCIYETIFFGLVSCVFPADARPVVVLKRMLCLSK